jgi:hypothetical protein
MNSASLRVFRAVNQAFQPGMDQRARTHRARFNCSKQFTVAETVVTNGSTSLAQGNDLGVGSGIAVSKIAVPAAADNASATDHDCAHRDLSCLKGTLGSAQGFFHPKFVGEVSGQWAVASG